MKNDVNSAIAQASQLRTMFAVFDVPGQSYQFFKAKAAEQSAAKAQCVAAHPACSVLTVYETESEAEARELLRADMSFAH